MNNNLKAVWEILHHARMQKAAMNLRRSTMIFDGDKPHRLVRLGSSFRQIMTDECGQPVSVTAWEGVVRMIDAHSDKGIPFQPHDVQTFNGWKVSPDLISAHIKKCCNDFELLDAIVEASKDE